MALVCKCGRMYRRNELNAVLVKKEDGSRTWTCGECVGKRHPSFTIAFKERRKKESLWRFKTATPDDLREVMGVEK